MSILIILIIVIIVLYCYGTPSGNSNDSSKNNNSGQESEKKSLIRLSFDMSERSYSSCLRDFYHILENYVSAEKYRSPSGMKVCVSIEANNNKYCMCYFSIEDYVRIPEEISFGKEFEIDDYSIRVKSENATGFTTSENAKREILLMMNPSLQGLHIVLEDEHIDRNSVVCRFSIEYTRQ